MSTIPIDDKLVIGPDRANIDARYKASNNRPYTSVAAAEAAINLVIGNVGLTVLVADENDPNYPEAKEYWVQPKGTTPETYGLVEKGTTDYNDLENKPTISDGGQGSAQIPLLGNVKVTATAAASGQTTGVAVTAGQNGEINMAFTLEKGADGQDGADGAPGHNPCLGRFAAVPSTFAETPRAGYYYYVDTVTDATTNPPTVETKIYKYNGTAWDTGTVVDVSNLSFNSGQDVTGVAIKNLNGDNDQNATGVLSAGAGNVLLEKIGDTVAECNHVFGKAWNASSVEITAANNSFAVAMDTVPMVSGASYRWYSELQQGVSLYLRVLDENNERVNGYLFQSPTSDSFGLYRQFTASSNGFFQMAFFGSPLKAKLCKLVDGQWETIWSPKGNGVLDTEVKRNASNIGGLNNLTTRSKTSLVDAINEVAKTAGLAYWRRGYLAENSANSAIIFQQNFSQFAGKKVYAFCVGTNITAFTASFRDDSHSSIGNFTLKNNDVSELNVPANCYEVNINVNRADSSVATELIVYISEELSVFGMLYEKLKGVTPTSETIEPLLNIPIIGTEDWYDTKISMSYITWSTGAPTGASSSHHMYKYNLQGKGAKKIVATVSGNTVIAAIAFYSDTNPTAASYLKNYSIQMANGIHTYETTNIPENAKCVVVTNKTADYQTPSIKIIGNDEEYSKKALSYDGFGLDRGSLYQVEDRGFFIETSAYRIRTIEPVYLKKGAKIGLRQYTVDNKNYQFYVGWYNNAGYFQCQGWLTSDFNVYEDGFYNVVAKSEPVDVLSNFTLADLIFIEQPTDFQFNTFVKGINHRGYSKYAPENTMMAFELSRKIGFKYIETDIQFTSDGVPVLVHDASINVYQLVEGEYVPLGTTVTISETSWDTLKDYYIGKSVYKDYNTQEMVYAKIARLDEFLVWCRNKGIHPYLEFKIHTTAQIKEVVDMVNGYGMSKNVSYISMIQQDLATVKTKQPNARLGYVVSSSVTESTITFVLSLKTDENEVFVDSNTFTDSEVELCKTSGVPLEIWKTGSYFSGAMKNLYLTMNGYISGVTSDLCDASAVLALYN